MAVPTVKGLLSGFEFKKQMYMTKEQILLTVKKAINQHTDNSPLGIAYKHGFEDGANYILQNLQQTLCTTQLPAGTWIEDDYCTCEYPTLGKSVSRCGTCDCWFKPIA